MFLAFTYLDLLLPAFRGGEEEEEEEEGVMRMGAPWSVLAWPFFCCTSFFFLLFKLILREIILGYQEFSKHANFWSGQASCCQHYCVY
jgi:hypothetical protein